MDVTSPARPFAALLAVVTLVAGCTSSTPDQTPYPTPVAPQPIEAASAVVEQFLGDWGRGRYQRMYRSLAASDRHSTSAAEFEGLLDDFERMAQVTGLEWTLGTAERTVLPAAPRPPDAPVPSPTRVPSGQTPAPTPSGNQSGTPQPTAPPPDTPLAGPRLGVRMPIHLAFSTANFGEVAMHRDLVLVAAADGWQVHWTSATLFPELGADGNLRLRRQAPVRGRIVAQDGTVFARMRGGARVYPQDSLAGQTIGYATPATEEDLKDGLSRGLRRGDLVGRSGLEAGADDLLAGTPGFKLEAIPEGGDPVTVLQRDMVPGADVVITLRRRIQATADAALAPYAEAGTAVLNPKNGDVWALASAPRFNPNAMTIGSSMSGAPLSDPGYAARLSHAARAAYPAGSSFKPFTLAAALKIGVADRSTRMSCNGTWTFSGFTFHNYMDHSLPGLVDLLQAMAFSCNTTYMPLSIRVYDKDKTALTDLLHEFGFGESTGIKHLADEPGVLPDAAYFEEAKRWDGKIHPYGPFDQIQLAIGQGSFLGTPLQLANAYAAFGNGGRLWVPRLVVEARLPDGTVIERNKPRIKQRISVSRSDLRYVVQSLKAVVNYPYGTGYPAFVGYGIQVGGKSGTAETGGPDPDAWFPAIAPADKPRIAAATVLVHIRLGTGGTDAAPLIRRVFSTYFAGR